MRRRRPALLDATALLLLAAVAGAQPGTRVPSIEDFLAEPVVRAVALSPSGDRVAYLLAGEPAARVGILETGDPATGGGERRTWPVSPQVEALHWRPDGAGLFLAAADVVAYLPDEAGSRPALVARLDPELRMSFAGVDPALPAEALLRQDPRGGPHRLLRLDADGHTAVVHESNERFGKVLLGDGGRVAFVQTAEGRDVVVRQALPGGGWREVLRCGVADACVPVASVDGRLLVRRRGGDGGRWELAAFDLADSPRHTGAAATLHRDPRALADLDRVVFDPRRGTPLLAVYDSDRLRSYALDPALAPPLERLTRLLPGRDLFIDPRIGGPWLVTATDARWQRPHHYLYDADSAANTALLRPLLEEERGQGVTLPESALAAKRHLSYRAADGRLVHGFVSVPPGVDASAVPLVVRVHGGPWNHVRSRFDTVTQFLVSRGYAVFEPDFRGSTGYGFDYMRAARGEYSAGRVHGDVVDGVDHLLAAGIGDPRRVAIVGHSFGGYATLGALAWSPGRFRAGVAMAPPVDLVRALGDLDPDTTLPNGLPLVPLLRDLMADFSDPRAVADLRSRSPEARYADTRAPLLVVAGGRDERVDLVDVEHYALALDELGRDVSLLVDAERGHQFESRLMRRATLYLLQRFLARHLGGTRGAGADPRLAAYLAANLRLRGESLDADTLGAVSHGGRGDGRNGGFAPAAAGARR